MYLSEYIAQAPTIVGLLLKLALSMFSGGFIGFERGRHGRSAGLRTHILVCLGSTIAAMVDSHVALALGSDGTRIAANVLTGIGFLGAGVILVKRAATVTGLTTAAGLWTTSVIGLCYGYGFCEIPLITTIVLLLVFTLLPHLEVGQKAEVGVYIEIDDLSAVNEVLILLQTACPMMLHSEVIPAKSGNTSHIGIRISATGKIAKKFKNPEDELKPILALPHVIYAVVD